MRASSSKADDTKDTLPGGGALRANADVPGVLDDGDFLHVDVEEPSTPPDSSDCSSICLEFLVEGWSASDEASECSGGELEEWTYLSAPSEASSDRCFTDYDKGYSSSDRGSVSSGAVSTRSRLSALAKPFVYKGGFFDSSGLGPDSNSSSNGKSGGDVSASSKSKIGKIGVSSYRSFGSLAAVSFSSPDSSSSPDEAPRRRKRARGRGSKRRADAKRAERRATARALQAVLEASQLEAQQAAQLEAYRVYMNDLQWATDSAWHKRRLMYAPHKRVLIPDDDDEDEVFAYGMKHRPETCARCGITRMLEEQAALAERRRQEEEELVEQRRKEEEMVALHHREVEIVYLAHLVAAEAEDRINRHLSRMLHPDAERRRRWARWFGGMPPSVEFADDFTREEFNYFSSGCISGGTACQCPVPEVPWHWPAWNLPPVGHESTLAWEAATATGATPSWFLLAQIAENERWAAVRASVVPSLSSFYA